MTQKNDGGLAFPVPPATYSNLNHGMSVRDYFAGQALVGLPSLCAHDTLLDGITFEQHVARNAYKLADAMIAAREAKPYAEPRAFWIVGGCEAYDSLQEAQDACSKLMHPNILHVREVTE